MLLFSFRLKLAPPHHHHCCYSYIFPLTPNNLSFGPTSCITPPPRPYLSSPCPTSASCASHILPWTLSPVPAIFGDLLSAHQPTPGKGGFFLSYFSPAFLLGLLLCPDEGLKLTPAGYGFWAPESPNKYTRRQPVQDSSVSTCSLPFMTRVLKKNRKESPVTIILSTIDVRADIWGKRGQLVLLLWTPKWWQSRPC